MTSRIGARHQWPAAVVASGSSAAASSAVGGGDASASAFCSPYGYICALALLFLRFDEEAGGDSGVSIRGGQTLWQLTYADDSALLAEARRLVESLE